MYPYYYGDDDSRKIKVNLKGFNEVATRTIGSVIILAFISTPASAVEPAVQAVANAKQASQVSLAITCAVCAAAGSVCTKAVEKTAVNNPKMAAAFGCVALISWCAAKASPY